MGYAHVSLHVDDVVAELLDCVENAAAVEWRLLVEECLCECTSGRDPAGHMTDTVSWVLVRRLADALWCLGGYLRLMARRSPSLLVLCALVSSVVVVLRAAVVGLLAVCAVWVVAFELVGWLLVLFLLADLSAAFFFVCVLVVDGLSCCSALRLMPLSWWLCCARADVVSLVVLAAVLLSPFVVLSRAALLSLSRSSVPLFRRSAAVVSVSGFRSVAPSAVCRLAAGSAPSVVLSSVLRSAVGSALPASRLAAGSVSFL